MTTASTAAAVLTWDVARANVKANVIHDLKAKGYTLTEKFNGHIDVALAGRTLGELTFFGIGATDNGKFYRGHVTFYPARTRGRRRTTGDYKVSYDGVVNVANLHTRLRREETIHNAMDRERAAEDARDSRDEALLARLGLHGINAIWTTKATPRPGVTVNVFDGKVSIDVEDLSEDDARTVLAALGVEAK